MNSVWQLTHDAMHCRVEWRDNHLYWQISHPAAPGGQTRLALVSDLSVNHQPVQ